ncbi:cyclic peptide transporter [Leptolyngbya sp. Heron Island J]|uniref:cyclic peptide export ABC transporter n=1 Tax=Leptolyngbya sp. Heron Island J TaxID=1385935 RepID=UPI0003B93E04|nr:cyclic peptide export ABC transporter [Leptolyngbya sp. Heron Island J]ESA32933.1 cyclic peptide transporter [Leptolyngbya sp. Heron Island J]
MGIIWLLIKASWVSVAMAILAGIISGGCSAKLIALINAAIQQNAPQSLIAPFAGLTILVLISSSFSQFLLIDLAQDSVYQLRLSLSRRILAAPLRQLERLGPNQLLAVLTEDVQAISNTVFILPFLCIDIAIIGGCLIYLGWLSGWVFLAVVTFLVMAIVLVQTLISYAHRYLKRVRQEMDLLLKHFRAITDGIKELKLHSSRRHHFLENDLTTSAATACHYQKTALKIAAVASGGGQLLFFVLVGLLIFVVPRVVTEAWAILPAYILTLTYLLGPIQSLVEQLPNLANADVSIKKVDEMGLTLSRDAELETVTRQNAIATWQTLQLQQVVHTYQSEDAAHRFTVGPINLTLQAGELVFIVGGNGSGKSTLAKLITGLYMPESGELCLDGTPITDTNREWYRQHFSTIFSDFYLFERLVRPMDGAFEQQTQTYLKTLELDKKVAVKDGQLSTTALSQGQRKRLALLSAYLEDRPIYLFDEWAADQDPVFREIFYTQLLAELKQRGKTLLVISHDDRYFHLADRIIKLDYGHIESDAPPA